jgi:hypothetical protein
MVLCTSSELLVEEAHNLVILCCNQECADTQAVGANG